MRILAALLAVVLFPGVAEATEDLAHWVAEGHTVHSLAAHSHDDAANDHAAHHHAVHDHAVHDHAVPDHAARNDVAHVDAAHDHHDTGHIAQHEARHEHAHDAGHDDARHDDDEHGCSPLFHLCGCHSPTASMTSPMLALQRDEAAHHDVLSPPRAKDERAHDGVDGETFRPPIS